MIEIISSCTNINLIIKFRETESFTLKSLEVLLGNLPSNVSLETKIPFGDLLSSSHLLMSFSSTTIEEALVNETPVLLYGGKGRYAHIPTKPFKLGSNDEVMKPVTFVDCKEDLALYLNLLNKASQKFINYPFKFNRFILKDSVSVIDWIDKNRILN